MYSPQKEMFDSVVYPLAFALGVGIALYLLEELESTLLLNPVMEFVDALVSFSAPWFGRILRLLLYVVLPLGVVVWRVRMRFNLHLPYVHGPENEAKSLLNNPRIISGIDLCVALFLVDLAMSFYLFYVNVLQY